MSTGPETMDAAPRDGEAGETMRLAAARFAGRAALACALVMVGLLVVTAVCFGILAAGASDDADFSWVFAVYVLPSVVILTVLLFVASLVLAVVALIRGRGAQPGAGSGAQPGAGAALDAGGSGQPGAGRGAAVAALATAVFVVIAYVGWALVLAALLHPNTVAAN